MRTLTALAMILFASCNRQNEAVKVNVPDTVRVVSPVVGQKAYVLWGDSVMLVYPYEALCLVPHWESPNRWRTIKTASMYPDSLSACRALRSRLEHQKDELNRKIDKLKCEGK